MSRTTNNAMGIVLCIAIWGLIGLIYAWTHGDGANTATLSRDQFTRLVYGKNKQEVIAAVGKPDETSETAGIPHWTYSYRTYDAVTGKADYRVYLTFGDGASVTATYYY